jgi:tRNA 2-thiouridine synthesizing protein B
MILHTLKTSPFETLAINNCLKLLSAQDSLLLMEDAVIASHAVHGQFQQLKLLAEQNRLFVLQADLDARGLEKKIGKSCSYLDFVELVIQHKSQLAW